MQIVTKYGTMWARNTENIRSVPGVRAGGVGVYILFDGSMPLYVGKGNIKHRITDARRSKRRGQLWDRFSWYAVSDPKMMHDLEVLVLRILPRYLRALTRKPTPHALFASRSSAIDPNVITISIQPDERISIAFDVKRPGTQVRTVTVQANFSYQTSFGSKGPVAYETLLLDSMRGDATLFTRRDEVEAEWRIITPIEEAWAQLAPPDFPNYAAGNKGPVSWNELLEIRGFTAEHMTAHRD